MDTLMGDFRQFTEFLRSQSRWGLVSQDVLGALSMGNVRDYQYYMAEQRWKSATVQRRLVSLNRFGAWLVKRGHTKTNPLAEMELPRKSRPLPHVVDWEILEGARIGERIGRHLHPHMFRHSVVQVGVN